MKLRHFAAVGALCLGVSLAAGSASALGFVNGSFETGDLTGWTSTEGSYNPFGTQYGQGMDGQYWHWLAGWERPVTTSQTISGLTAGTTYAVKFIMASEFKNSDSLRVSANGGPGSIFTSGPYTPGGFNGGFWDSNWEAKQFQFTATSNSATIQFDTVGLNVRGYDVGLDNVSISVAGGVPEPMTWAMMLVGFAGLGAVMRANRRADRELAALAG